jgi:hypothetical protein
VESSAQFSGQLLLAARKTPVMTQKVACVIPDLLRSVELDMQIVMVRGASLSDKGDIQTFPFFIWPFLYSPVVQARFGRQQRYVLTSDANLPMPALHKIPTESEINTSRIDFLQKALFLQATSIAVIAALEKRQETSPIDLSGTALVAGEIRPVDGISAIISTTEPEKSLSLAGVNLRNSYIGVPVSRTSFDGVDLSYSDLREIQIRGGVTFAGAIVTGAIVADDEVSAFTSAQGEISPSGSPNAQARKRIASETPIAPFCEG